MTGLKPYTEETFADACEASFSRFGDSVRSQMERVLQNPLRHQCAEAGDVAYEKGKPVGFQAAILRKLYMGQQPFLGVVGGLLAMKEGASPVLLLQLMKKTRAPRGGSKLFFANTSNPQSMKLNQALGVKGKGPDSCACVRWRPIHWGNFAKLCLHGRLPSFMRVFGNFLGRAFNLFFLRKVRSTTTQAVRLTTLDVTVLDDFWQRYLDKNTGLVSSRTAEELSWLYDKGLKNGQYVFLGRKDLNGLCGYIVLRRANAGNGRWMIADWIALDDNPDVLSDLVHDAVCVLHDQKDAATLESVGFPPRVQGVLHRHLPFTRKSANNTFIYQPTDLTISSKINPDEGWFFGPYDGDRCL
ncbi:MAG: hypothetical protein IJL17_07440 [Kiritimatiellae bacterium]|nr:hypothetical protein [Kiritimatiellia bacterium]